MVVLVAYSTFANSGTSCPVRDGRKYFKTLSCPPSAKAANTKSLSCKPCSTHKRIAGVSISEIYRFDSSLFDVGGGHDAVFNVLLNAFEVLERKKASVVASFYAYSEYFVVQIRGERVKWSRFVAVSTLWLSMIEFSSRCCFSTIFGCFSTNPHAKPQWPSLSFILMRSVSNGFFFFFFFFFIFLNIFLFFFFFRRGIVIQN